VSEEPTAGEPEGGAEPGAGAEPEGGGEAGAGAEPPAPPGPPTCAVCGATLDADQTYCLECGSPTPLAPRYGRGRRSALIAAAAVAVLGLGAGALAYAVSSDDGSSGGATITATTPGGTAPAFPGTVPPGPTTGSLPADTSITTPSAPSTSPATTGFDTVTGPSASSPSTESTPTTPSGPAGSDWPAGKTGWTAVLSSVRSESDARAAKARVSSSGQPAGILFSSDYPPLRSGYWVVYSGVYDAQSAAAAQASRLRAKWPGAYARRIVG
jgi:eukaryotic-like serine/threonine-protein kinase